MFRLQHLSFITSYKITEQTRVFEQKRILNTSALIWTNTGNADLVRCSWDKSVKYSKISTTKVLTEQRASLNIILHTNFAINVQFYASY